MIKTSFTATEAAHLAGLSRTMVDYLCRTKLSVPTSPQKRGRGRQRAYRFGDVVLLRAIARMLHAGITVSNLKRGLQALRKRHGEITPGSLPATHLVTDGRHIYFQHGHEVLEGLNSGQYAFAFVLELNVLKKEVLTQLEAQTEADGADAPVRRRAA